MRRRELIAGSLAVVSLPRAFGQAGSRSHRVAFLPLWGQTRTLAIMQGAYRDRLARHGFVEGRNLELRSFFTEEAGPGWFEKAVRDALAWNPDVIQVSSSQAVRVARAATASIPIVFTRVNDPVANGLVASIARPGGNVTGVMVHQTVLTLKRLEFVREVLPQARRAAVIIDRSMRAISAEAEEEIRVGARRLGLDLAIIDPSQEHKHLAGAFEAAAELRAEAVVPAAFSRTDERDGPGWRAITAAVVAWQRTHKVPVISGFSEEADFGLFASVGSNFVEEWQLAADLTAAILGGADPAGVAIQQLHRIEVVINLRTARELEIKVPRAVLLRADRVIE